MSPELTAVLGIVAVIALIMCRMWVGVAMGLVGFVGLLVLRGPAQALMIAGQVPFTNVNNYTMTVIPMFTFMGMLISESNIGRDLFRACNAWFGSLKGGLASATVAATGGLGAITGSHMVGTVIMSKIALPEMRRYKYDEPFSAATIAAAAPLTMIIPPSLSFIMYGIITEQNIGKLFMSGFIPGIIMMAIFIGFITIVCRRNPAMGPAGPRASMRERLRALAGIVPVVALFILIFGGIYAGFFTTTESGAIGCAGALAIAASSRQMNMGKLLLALRETVLTTGMIFTLLIGTYIFISFITLSKLPFMITRFVASIDAPMPVMILAVSVMYIVLGMILPEIPMIILTIPVLYPALTAVGFDPIWLGLFVVIMMALGAISPPIGMVVFMLSGFSGVSVVKIFRAVIPFIVADIIVVILISVFPQLATWLPSTM
ncbi:MAG: TRAP transporter large permease [Clostridiales Family XIII bacterium]|jgi:tripartite ATP-independent transporter DctM subunit|nr:TRAP transporter large permease [Clostridiales Family XIII bacterium]